MRYKARGLRYISLRVNKVQSRRKYVSSTKGGQGKKGGEREGWERARNKTRRRASTRSARYFANPNETDRIADLIDAALAARKIT